MERDLPTLTPAADDPPLPSEPPSRAAGLAKLVCGAVMALLLLGGLISNGYQGGVTAAAFGLPIGLFVWMALAGGANLAGARPGLAFGGIVTVLITALSAMAGPGASASNYRDREQKFWDEHDKHPHSLYTWQSLYPMKIPAQFRRKEYPYRLMLERAQSAVQAGDIKRLREVIRDIKKQPTGEKPHYDPAMKIAAGKLQGVYDAALQKIAGAATGTAKPDEKLRAAFRAVLTDLAHSESATVHVAFTNQAILRQTRQAEQVLALMRRQPPAKAVYPRGDAPLIGQGGAFAPKYDQQRRTTFLIAMKSAFGKVFGSTLFELQPLPPKQPRKGKLVFEVGSRIERLPTYYTYTRDKKFHSFLFGIVVLWSFKVHDRRGRQLYESPLLRSNPAQHIDISSRRTDPTWAPYSIMMDSAYYNYSRVVIGRFGLVPPPEKTAFSFR